MAVWIALYVGLPIRRFNEDDLRIHQEDLLEHTEAIQDLSMVDQEPLPVIILVIQLLEGHNLTVRGHKETVHGLLIPVGLRLILKEESIRDFQQIAKVDHQVHQDLQIKCQDIIHLVE